LDWYGLDFSFWIESEIFFLQWKLFGATAQQAWSSSSEVMCSVILLLINMRSFHYLLCAHLQVCSVEIKKKEEMWTVCFGLLQFWNLFNEERTSNWPQYTATIVRSFHDSSVIRRKNSVEKQFRQENNDAHWRRNLDLLSEAIKKNDNNERIGIHSQRKNEYCWIELDGLFTIE